MAQAGWGGGGGVCAYAAVKRVCEISIRDIQCEPLPLSSSACDVKGMPQIEPCIILNAV